MYILSATGSCPPQDLYIEQAQLYWQKGAHEEAITTLKRCMSNYFADWEKYKKAGNEPYTKDRKQCAKSKLLWAKYNDETLNVESNVNMSNYKTAYEIGKCCEKNCVSIARYYESVIEKMSDEDRDLNGRSRG